MAQPTLMIRCKKCGNEWRSTVQTNFLPVGEKAFAQGLTYTCSRCGTSGDSTDEELFEHFFSG